MAVGLFDTFAFVAGAATFFAPCAFPLLPGYVSYYVGRDRPDGGAASERGARTALASTVGRAAVVGVVVSLGFFVVYGVLAGVVVFLGSTLLSGIGLLELVVGAIMIAVGAAMAAGVDLSIGHVPLPERRRSLLGFFAFGVLYAAAAAGCTAGVFFGLVAGSLARDPVAGLSTMVAYALGMSLLMIAVTVATALGRDLLVRRIASRTALIQRVAGVLLVLAGLAQIYIYLVWFGGLATLGL